MKALILGAAGQLGSELARTAPSGVRLVCRTSAQCNVADEAAVRETLGRERPDLIINAAAYTAVDKAESEPELAHAVNALGPANLAAASGGARVFHLSTDFVFDGAQGHAYRVSDVPNPQSVYGRTKLEGERPILALGPKGLVLRTSWVYSAHGHNFVKTMLRLMRSRPEVRVVADQVGCPTWARGLAEALWRAADLTAIHGLHHWRDAGTAAWYDFAVAIAEEARSLRIIETPVTVEPIETRDYPTPARRPPFSLLDCGDTWRALGIRPPHWREQLRRMLVELGNASD